MRLVKIIFIIIIIPFFLLVKNVEARTEGEIQSDIDKYTQELTRLSSQSQTLSNQIAQYNAQINLTSLKIAQVEEKITLLGGRIDQLEVSLEALAKAYEERTKESYKMVRVGDSLLLLLSSPNLTEAVSRFHYLQRIQQADESLLQRLQKAQTDYKEQKTEQETLQEELNRQKNTLAQQKQAKNQLLTLTKNDERKYQSLLSQAKSELDALKRFVSGHGGASILQNQTKCDSWGCYYNQRDSQWGNMGLGGSSYSVAEYGCLVTSVSMVASHYGKNIKPNDIAAIQSAFFPGTGYLNHNFSVNGINVSISNASKSILDNELSAGRPVIAGLFSGPDHFIVILRKDGDNYIMHDPFFENGGNMRFQDKYNVSNINSLRLVQFNLLAPSIILIYKYKQCVQKGFNLVIFNYFPSFIP